MIPFKRHFFAFLIFVFSSLCFSMLTYYFASTIFNDSEDLNRFFWQIVAITSIFNLLFLLIYTIYQQYKARPNRIKTEKAPHKKGDHITLLTVDDNPANLLIIEQHLQGESVVITKANNGDEAFTAFLEHQPDIILMDIEMDGMNGIDATKKYATLNLPQKKRNARRLLLPVHTILTP